MKKITIIISAFLFLGLALVSLSDSASVSQWEDDIYLVEGEVASIGVVGPRRVGITDPEIADIDSVSNEELILVGKSAGNTTLSIWDKLGQRTLNVKVVAENLDYLKARLEQLLVEHLGLKEIIIRISQPEGKIVLLGRIRPDKEENLGLLLEPFSDKVINLIKVEEDVLVQTDVLILELSKNAQDTLGVVWPHAIALTVPEAAGVKLKDMLSISHFTRGEITATINFLATSGQARVLSRPKLVCLSGKEADFIVGGELPIVTTNVSGDTITSNVIYRDYGVKLNIQPKVGDDDRINVVLHAEVSEESTSQSVETTSVVAPAFGTRTVETELMLRDGQTVFLAGLIKNKDTTTLKKFPGLADIPIIGALFRSKDFLTDETELVISLTPTIIRQRKITKEVVEEKAVLPAISSVEPEDPILKYTNNVLKIISDSIYFPSQAKDAGWEGKVNLKLHIQSSGDLDEVDIVRSSGYQLFDDVAISVVKGLSPYPPFPATIQSNELWVELPVVFQKN